MQKGRNAKKRPGHRQVHDAKTGDLNAGSLGCASNRPQRDCPTVCYRPDPESGHAFFLPQNIHSADSSVRSFGRTPEGHSWLLLACVPRRRAQSQCQTDPPANAPSRVEPRRASWCRCPSSTTGAGARAWWGPGSSRPIAESPRCAPRRSAARPMPPTPERRRRRASCPGREARFPRR